MEKLFEANVTELQEYLSNLQKQYNQFKNENLKLDMSRGKPCSEQLDISMEMLDFPKSTDSCKASDGSDCRNYGGLDGLPEVKQMFSNILEVEPKEIIVGGNSSLNMMYDTIARAMLFGVVGGDRPWSHGSTVKFLCPSPGYDRHFAICELFGIEMLTVPMNEDGPDMDTIEELVANDENIKGIWCVPKYSNPDGITYSDRVVDRFAKMKVKAKDFRIFWDNAYVIHHLTDTPDHLKNILTACKEVGNADRVFIFSSTSKVSFPGAGVAVMATSENNITHIKKQLSIQTIGPDKINQLRHSHFFNNMENLEKYMKKHASIIKPKFDMVLDILERELGGKEIAWWNKPNGGYFISLNTMEGCAKDVYELAGAAGVTLTKVGATFPYGKDPSDRNIRIAPTYPSLEELGKAIEIVCICVQIVSVKKILNNK